MMYTIKIFVIEYIHFKKLKTGVYIDNSKKTATCKAENIAALEPIATLRV